MKQKQRQEIIISSFRLTYQGLTELLTDTMSSEISIRTDCAKTLCARSNQLFYKCRTDRSIYFDMNGILIPYVLRTRTQFPDS